VSELKPCPFCGSGARVTTYTAINKSYWDPPDVSYWISCNKYPRAQIAKGCVVDPSTSHFKTKEEAIEAWNTRHE